MKTRGVLQGSALDTPEGPQRDVAETVVIVLFPFVRLIADAAVSPGCAQSEERRQQQQQQQQHSSEASFIYVYCSPVSCLFRPSRLHPFCLCCLLFLSRSALSRLSLQFSRPLDVPLQAHSFDSPSSATLTKRSCLEASLFNHHVVVSCRRNEPFGRSPRSAHSRQVSPMNFQRLQVAF